MSIVTLSILVLLSIALIVIFTSVTKLNAFASLFIVVLLLSMIAFHEKDSYFWVILRFSGISSNTMLKVYSTATIVMGIVMFLKNITILCARTDGTDGPTDATGAVIGGILSPEVPEQK